jgi:hypothetical protein
MLLAGGILLSLLSGTVLLGQFGRFRTLYQNDPPDTEFVFARWRYGSGGGGWNHDYPYAEEHINQVMHEATGIGVERMSYRIVDIASEEIFDYPFGYISEPGQMWLSETEVENFREYVDRGGFVMIDDFDGEYHFSIMYDNLKRVFPDREPRVLTDAHPMLHTFYDIDNLYVESPYAVGGAAVFYGIDDALGNLAVVICYNNDVGDFWEHIDNHRYALKPSTEALRLGINIVLYAMTH